MSGFQRVILHYGSDPTDFRGVVSQRAISGCWFELHRQGGCGAGELRIKDRFVDRHSIEIGDWIAFEPTLGDRWYFGRVEHRESTSPAGISFRLEGMGVQLGEVFPGGFGPDVGDGNKPHVYQNTDLFPLDPDRDVETFDLIGGADDVVRKLIQQYVASRTDIKYVSNLIDDSPSTFEVQSLKVRGEESVRSIIKELALRARDASWGVDEEGQFFFLQKKDDLLATYQEGRDLTLLEESRERDNLFNRVVLTGGYVYDRSEGSGQIARRSYRWRGNYIQPDSREAFGERRIRMWVPWIRTLEDSQNFVREFFWVYSQPTSRFLIETIPQSVLPRPWLGEVKLEANDGSELLTAAIETVRVEFDHSARLRMELGPEDPRRLFPEPPHDERFELPEGHPFGYGGGELPLTGGRSDGGGGPQSSMTSEESSKDVISSSLEGSSDVSSMEVTSLISENISSSDFYSSDITSSGNFSSGEMTSGISMSSFDDNSSVNSEGSEDSSEAKESSNGNGGGGNSSGGNSSGGGGSSGDESSSLAMNSDVVESSSGIVSSDDSSSQ